MGKFALVALGAVASGCLGAPPDSPGGGDTADAAPECDTAFAVAYVDGLSVDPDGGVYAGVLVIEALGAQVDLNHLHEGPDDGIAVELELSQPAYQITPPGLVSGVLDAAAAGMILDGGLIDEDAWDGGAPTFGLRFDPVAEFEPSAHVIADVFVGDSRAVLEFDISYDGAQGVLAIPLGARRVESACGE